MRILFLIGRQFNLLMQVKELKRKGWTIKKSGGEKTGLHGFVVRKYVSQASRFTMAELKKRCRRAWRRMKPSKQEK